MHLLARRTGLIEADRRPAVHLLKVHLPYHESDHVLNIAYNVLCRRHVPGGHRAAAQRRGLPGRPGGPADPGPDHGGRLLPAVRRPTTSRR